MRMGFTLRPLNAVPIGAGCPRTGDRYRNSVPGSLLPNLTLRLLHLWNVAFLTAMILIEFHWRTWWYWVRSARVPILTNFAASRAGDSSCNQPAINASWLICSNDAAVIQEYYVPGSIKSIMFGSQLNNIRLLCPGFSLLRFRPSRSLGTRPLQTRRRFAIDLRQWHERDSMEHQRSAFPRARRKLPSKKLVRAGAKWTR